MRLFIGVDLSQELKEKASLLLKEIEKADADIKFTSPENLHFNLKFIGDTEEKRIDEIKKALNDVSSKTKAFKITIDKIGVFPSWDYIKIIWIGMKEGSEDMKRLAELTDSSLHEIGFEKDGRKFVPHLTLGRVKSKRNKEKLASLLKILKSDIGSMEVSEIILYESVLGAEGPTYKKLHVSKLSP